MHCSEQCIVVALVGLNAFVQQYILPIRKLLAH